jgi:hypothetical protein
MSRLTRHGAAFIRVEDSAIDLPKIKDGLAIAGVIAGLTAGFFWASSSALRNAFFAFFGESRFVAPLSYEDMIYQGALGQIRNLVLFALVPWGVWLLARELNDPKYPKAVKLRDGIVGFLRFLLPLLWLALIWLVMFALQDAEISGHARALQLARSAEAGTSPITRISRRVGDQVAVIEGVRLGCSEKFCALYQHNGAKTPPDATRAAGVSVLVPLDGVVSIATTPSKAPASAH